MVSQNSSKILSGIIEPIDSGNANLGKLILDALKSEPDFVGQIDAITGKTETYREMAEKSVRCALWLKKQGLNPGELVFVSCCNTLDNSAPILATFYNGATIRFGYKGIQLQLARHLFSLTKPKFLFTDEEELKVYEQAAKEENLDLIIITFTKVPGYYYLNDILQESESTEVIEFSPLAPLSPDDICNLPLTSGTTGKPKLVILTYQNITEGILSYKEKKKEVGKRVNLSYYPPFWAPALRNRLVDILNYDTRIIADENSHDLDEIFQLIEKYKVTRVEFSMGVMLRMYDWKDYEKYDTSSIKVISYGGMKLPVRLIEFLIKVAKNGHVLQAYGATESLGISLGIMNTIDPNSCGRLRPNTSLKVINVKSGEILGPKEVGEFCIKSPSMMKGYFKEKEATDAVIDSEGWYHTGDLGSYDENGLLFYHARVKNSTFLSNGEILPLYEVERVFLLNVDVIKTVVMSHGDESSGTLKIVGFVVLSTGSKITENELIDNGHSIVDIKFPLIVKILDALPLTPTGKFDHVELRKLIV